MAEKMYFLTESDRKKLLDTIDRGYGRPILHPAAQRRRRIKVGSSRRAGGGATDLRRAISLGFDKALGYNKDQAGEGTFVFAPDYGDTTVYDGLINYFDDIPEKTPGWAYYDGESYWFINAGCNTGPEIDFIS